MPSNTFWNLVKNYNIIIPDLQRDYAQGRKNPEITQIRESLIGDLYNSLTAGRTLTLNFIYGSKNGKKFTPIDGQQRLTTLFLLHWYMFSRSNFTEGLACLLTGFSYKTRDTSRRFCEGIVENGRNLDFSKETLRDQIEDSPWFAGSFFADPTVDSMLRVIDDIHKVFKNADSDVVKNQLIESCPISFLWLKLDDFEDTDDLYIKMNARGKVLTDFEIFKAKLQSSSIIEPIIDEKSDAGRIELISKFNNQYAETFYSFCSNSYDSSMFAFFRNIIRDEFCSYAAEKSVAQGIYREDYKKFSKMNGNMLFSFLEKGRFDSSEYDKCSDSETVLSGAICKVKEIFDIYYENKERIALSDSIHRLSSWHMSDKEMFFVDYSKSNMKNDWIRYAALAYLCQFGYPDNDEKALAFNMWKRLIYNIINNTDVAGHTEYYCQTLIVIRALIENIVDVSAKGILEMMNRYQELIHNDNSIQVWDVGIGYQIQEEIIKARLMLRHDGWYKAILEAEEYYEDGQIMFLLDYSFVDEDYNLDEFCKGFAISKTIFAGKKRLLCDEKILEKALLCMTDPTTNQTGHLLKQSNSRTSWGFCGTDYFRTLLSNTPGTEKAAKQKIIISLLRQLNQKDPIEEQLSRIVAQFDSGTLYGKSLWKKAFIDYDIFGSVIADDVVFDNCVHLNRNNTEVLLLGGTTVRSKSMELNTLILYYKMLEKGISAESIKRLAHPTGDIAAGNSFPYRCLEYRNHKIGYINDEKPHFVVKDSQEVIVEKSEDSILDYVLSL